MHQRQVEVIGHGRDRPDRIAFADARDQGVVGIDHAQQLALAARLVQMQLRGSLDRRTQRTQQQAVERVAAGLGDQVVDGRIAGNALRMVVGAGRTHGLGQIAHALALSIGGVAGGQLRGLQLDRAARLEHVGQADLGRVQRVVEHLRQHAGVDLAQTRLAAAFDRKDAERCERAVGLPHAAAADLQIKSNAHLAGDRIAGAQLLAVDQRKQMPGDLGRQRRSLDGGQRGGVNHGQFRDELRLVLAIKHVKQV